MYLTCPTPTYCVINFFSDRSKQKYLVTLAMINKNKLSGDNIKKKQSQHGKDDSVSLSGGVDSEIRRNFCSQSDAKFQK